MKNPLLAIIALVALAGILFAQSPPLGGGAHPIIRKIELVGPIQVEGIVPLRNHISIPWASTWPAYFSWVCPPGTHARVTLAAASGATQALLDLASGTGSADLRYPSDGNLNPLGEAPQFSLRDVVLHPGDTLRLRSYASTDDTGILQLALEYD